jgi:hypothetical protein
MDLLALTGGLCLARMRPILECAGTPRLEQIDNVVAACGTTELRDAAKSIASLTTWRATIGQIEESSTPTYFQANAIRVATVAISNEMPVRDREWQIRCISGNFWDSCDDLLDSGGGFSRKEFKGIKTTLRGIEDMWLDGDIRLLYEPGVDVGRIYAERLSKIRSNYPKRRAIARIVAECGGWEPPTISP